MWKIWSCWAHILVYMYEVSYTITSYVHVHDCYYKSVSFYSSISVCASIDNREGEGIGNAIHIYWCMLATVTWFCQSLRIAQYHYTSKSSIYCPREGLGNPVAKSPTDCPWGIVLVSVPQCTALLMPHYIEPESANITLNPAFFLI